MALNEFMEDTGDTGGGVPGGAGSWGPVIGSIITGLVQGGPRRQYKWNKKAAADSNEMNRANQQWLMDQNLRIQKEQREYDSAEAQMKRYIDAGLNPHLIYGSGGGAGGVFPVDAGNMPGINIQAPSSRYPDVVGSYLGAGQSLAQTALAQSRTGETKMNTVLKSILVDVAKTNPMLRTDVADAVAGMTLRVAELKKAEAGYMKESWIDRDVDHSERIYVAKIRAELEADFQRLGLNNADLAIKNKIFESKEFENYLKDIQVKWMKDGEFTWQHAWQAGMLILNKMMGK